MDKIKLQEHLEEKFRIGKIALLSAFLFLVSFFSLMISIIVLTSIWIKVTAITFLLGLFFAFIVYFLKDIIDGAVKSKFPNELKK